MMMMMIIVVIIIIIIITCIVADTAASLALRLSPISHANFYLHANST